MKQKYINQFDVIEGNMFTCLKFTKAYRETLYYRLEKYFSNEKNLSAKEDEEKRKIISGFMNERWSDGIKKTNELRWLLDKTNGECFKTYESYNESNWLRSFIRKHNGCNNLLIDFALNVGENEDLEDLNEVRKEMLNQLATMQADLDQNQLKKIAKNNNSKMKEIFKNKFLNTCDFNDENWADKFLKNGRRVTEDEFLAIDEKQCNGNIFMGLLRIINEDSNFRNHILTGDMAKEKFEHILSVVLDSVEVGDFNKMINDAKEKGYVDSYFEKRLVSAALHVEKNQNLSETRKFVLNMLSKRELVFDEGILRKVTESENGQVKSIFKNKFLNTCDFSDTNWTKEFLSHFNSLSKERVDSDEVKALKLIGDEITDPQRARTICVALIELVENEKLTMSSFSGFGLLEKSRLFVTAFGDFLSDNDKQDKMESKLAYLEHLFKLRDILRQMDVCCDDCFPFGRSEGFTEQPKVVEKLRSFIEKNKDAQKITENKLLYSINWSKPEEFENVNINWDWVSKHQLDSIDKKQGWNILLLFINSKQEKKIDYGNRGRDLYEKDSDDLKIFEEIVDNIIDAKEKTNFDTFLEHVDLNNLLYNGTDNDIDNLGKLSGSSNQLDNNRLEKIFSIIVDSVFKDKDNEYAKYQAKVKDYIKNNGFVTPSVLWNQNPEVLKKIFYDVQPSEIFVENTIKEIYIEKILGKLNIQKDFYKNLTKCFWTPKQVKTVFGEECYKTWMKNCFPLFFDKSFINENVYKYGTNYVEYKPYRRTGFLINYGKEYLAACAKDKSINDVIMFFIEKPVNWKFTAEEKKNVLGVIGAEMVANKTKMSRKVVDELNKNENTELLSNELKDAMKNVEEIKEDALEEEEKDNVGNDNDIINVHIEVDDNIINNNDKRIESGQKNNIDIEQRVEKVNNDDNRQDNNIIVNDNAKKENIVGGIPDVNKSNNVVPEPNGEDVHAEHVGLKVFGLALLGLSGIGLIPAIIIAVKKFPKWFPKQSNNNNLSNNQKDQSKKDDTNK